MRGAPDVNADPMVQLALPAAVLEDLLRRQHLYLEQVRSLDRASHRELQRLVMRVAGNVTRGAGDG